MKLVGIDKLHPGMKLARPLLSEKGDILLSPHATLTVGIIARLRYMKVPYLYVLDDRFENVDVCPIVPIALESRTIRALKSSMDEVEKTINTGTFHFKVAEIRKCVKSVVEEILSKPAFVMHMFDLKYNDSYTYRHSLQVMYLSVLMGVKSGLGYFQLMNLAIGALLHDLGKLFIPREILEKPGRLNEEEWVTMKKHPRLGFDILKEQDEVMPTSRSILLQHHERYDGTGYPCAMMGQSIHAYSRMVSISDVFDAITSDRPYREPMAYHDALEYISSGANEGFDPVFVEIFKRCVTPYPVGEWVLLSTGHAGMVTSVHEAEPARPKIHITQHNRLGELQKPIEINLRDYPAVLVARVFKEEPSIEQVKKARTEVSHGAPFKRLTPID